MSALRFTAWVSVPRCWLWMLEGLQMTSLVDRITAVLRRDGWTCEYHEPVSGTGECSQCDDAHRRTAERVAEALRADLIELDGELEQRRSKHAIEMDADDFDCGAERAYREAQLMLRQIIARWTAVEGKP